MVSSSPLIGTCVKLVKVLSLLSVASFATACSTSNVFQSYPKQVGPAIELLYQGDEAGALEIVGGKDGKRFQKADRILALMEAGRISFLAGNYEVSARHFEDAIAAIEQDDDAAIVQASSLGEQAAATMMNDNAIPYSAAGYERQMAYHYQALNFMMMGDLGRAGVEMRNSVTAAERARLRFEKESEKAESEYESTLTKASAAGASMASLLGSAQGKADESFARIDTMVNQAGSGVVNPMVTYLAGLVFELQGDIDLAVPNYRDAWRYRPSSHTFTKTLMRYVDGEERADLEERSTIELAETENTHGMSPEIIVFVSDGITVKKQQIKLLIPANRGVSAFTFPYYEEDLIPFADLTLTVAEETAVRPIDPILNTQLLAYRDLRDKLSMILVRAVTRSIAKAVVANEVGGRDAMAGLGVSLFNVLSENADLRSWNTLPLHYHMYRGSVPEGTHQVIIADSGSPIAKTQIEAEEGKINVLYVSRLSSLVEVRSMSISKPSIMGARSTDIASR